MRGEASGRSDDNAQSRGLWMESKEARKNAGSEARQGSEKREGCPAGYTAVAGALTGGATACGSEPQDREAEQWSAQCSPGAAHDRMEKRMAHELERKARAALGCVRAEGKAHEL